MWLKKMTSESEILAQISTYVVENKVKSTLEAERLQDLAVKANAENREGHYGQTSTLESRRLDCVYDNEPLGFEKDPLNTIQKIQA